MWDLLGCVIDVYEGSDLNNCAFGHCMFLCLQMLQHIKLEES